jgi:hypothetical protein
MLKATPNNSLNRSAISKLFIENLSVARLISGGLDTVLEVKRFVSRADHTACRS